mgnify:CR=1 FL=1
MILKYNKRGCVIIKRKKERKMLSSVIGLMSKEGPIVKAVEVDTDGTEKEIELDMTPAKNEITKVLQGKATFVGCYGKEDIVIMCVREDQFKDDIHKENT